MAKAKLKPAKACEAASQEQGVPLAEETDEQTETDLIALHRARFIEWIPTAVTALAASSDGTVLAAARESGNVELWHTDHWSVAVVLPGP